VGNLGGTWRLGLEQCIGMAFGSSIITLSCGRISLDGEGLVYIYACEQELEAHDACGRRAMVYK